MLDPTRWANRPHPGPRTVPLAITSDQLEAVETAIRPAKAEKRIVRRGEAVRLMAAGVAAPDIAALLGVHIRTVYRWRVRFSCPDPVAKLADALRSGRPRSLALRGGLCEGRGRGVSSPQRRGLRGNPLVDLLLGEHIRSMQIDMSDSSVGRILRGALLQPHRQKMWLTSQDDEFRQKRDDVLRVYYETPRTSTSSASTRRRVCRRWNGATRICPCSPACRSAVNSSISDTAPST